MLVTPRNRIRMAVVAAGGRPCHFTSYAKRSSDSAASMLSLRPDAPIKFVCISRQSDIPLSEIRVVRRRSRQYCPERASPRRDCQVTPQFLHAHELGFRHPRTQQELRFTAPLPSELTEVLALIRTQQS
jgi:23S rRNA pseudouridine1911/1915/1917 synthase